MFLSSAKTTKCFLCIENSVSFFCQDNKAFLAHREQCFFLLPRQQSVSCAQGTVFLLLRQQSVSCAQGTVFLSPAKTTKCFLCTGNSVSFAKTTKCFLSHWYYYTVYKCLHSKYYVIPNMHWKQFRCLLQWWPIGRKEKRLVLKCKRAFWRFHFFCGSVSFFGGGLNLL